MENKKCVICDQPLNGNRKKYCSSKCSGKNSYETNKKIINTNSYHRQMIKGISRKIELIKIRGGVGCEICNYKKNIAALEFHHKNENEKVFSLDIRNLANKSWESILLEADKCSILCSNCHREHHNPELFFDTFDFSYEERKMIDSCCLDCNKKIDYKATRCKICSDKNRRKAERPDYTVLIKEIESFGYLATGKKYGVSDNAIRKWLKK